MGAEALQGVNAELVQLLHEVDGHLGLAVYRGEHDQRWKDEAKALIVRLRETARRLEEAT